MGKESSNILDSDIDCSAELNSTFDKVIFEMWDEESLNTIQNKLISFINLRYGDTLEEILRKDVNYSHLFEAFPMSSNGTADIPSPIKPQNSIVPLKSVIIGNNTETKNVSSDKKSKKLINIVNISKLKGIFQYKKVVPKEGVQKVIVEYSNNGVFVSRTNSLSICENSTDNNHCAKGDKKTGKNKENDFTLNIKTKLNTKLKSSKVSNKENDGNYVPAVKRKKLENLKSYLPQKFIRTKIPSKNEFQFEILDDSANKKTHLLCSNKLEDENNELQNLLSKEKVTDDKIKDAPKIKIMPPDFNHKEEIDTTEDPKLNVSSFEEISERFSEKNASVCKSTKIRDEKNTEDKATKKCVKNIEFNENIYEERSIIGKHIYEALIIHTPSVHSDDKCITSIEEDKEDKQFSSVKKNESNSSKSAYKDEVKISNSQEKPNEIYSDGNGEDLMILPQQEKINEGTYKVEKQLEITRNEMDVLISSSLSEKVDETNKVEHLDTSDNKKERCTTGNVYLEYSEIVVEKELEGISISTTENKFITETNKVKHESINDKKETHTKGDVDLKHSEASLMNEVKDFSNILEDNQLHKMDEKEVVIKEDFDLTIGNEEEYLSNETKEEEKLVEEQKETETKKDINLQHLEIPTNNAEQLITIENQKETYTKQDIDLKHEMIENNEVEDVQMKSSGEKIQETNEPNLEGHLFSIRNDQENYESKSSNLRENREEIIGDIDTNSSGDIEKKNIQQIHIQSDEVNNVRIDSNNERSILEHKNESVYETILSNYAKMKQIDHKKQATTNGNILNQELNAEHVFIVSKSLINSNYTTKTNPNTISSTKKSQEIEEGSRITYMSTSDTEKSDNTSNFLVKVEYKKSNSKDNTQSMAFMKNEYLNELSKEDKCLQVKRLPLENDEKLQNTPTRKRNRDQTDSEPNKYELRSASVEDKKKKRRKFYGTTEIVTRSRLSQQFQ